SVQRSAFSVQRSAFSVQRKGPTPSSSNLLSACERSCASLLAVLMRREFRRMDCAFARRLAMRVNER
ncbi:MAG: hypothetical protein OXC68_03225, partial [Aestuariivita sp.]|nr:hypothetical protein [Aestuariivita sp.]